MIALAQTLWVLPLFHTGCKHDVRLVGKNIPSAEVKTVEHYGITFDQQATPEQAAFAVLRAIRGDFEAKTPEDRQQALDVQFDLCAADVIAQNKGSAQNRDEFVYHVVYQWTPTVSHYAGDFETDWEQAKKRLVRREPSDSKPSGGDSGNNHSGNTNDNGSANECEILMEVDDPSGDPAARVVLAVWLVKDSEVWRVTHLGFEPGTRAMGG